MSLSATDAGSRDYFVHGVLVPDPYRWLEDRTSADTERWITSQQELHRAYFHGLAHVDHFRTCVANYLDIEVVDQPSQTGHWQIYRRRKQGCEQASICARDLTTNKEMILVDAQPLGPVASVGIRRISEDVSLLAYEVRHGGEDVAEIHLVEVESGRLLPDSLPLGYCRGFVFSEGATGFYYCQDTTETSSHHELRFHFLGKHPDRDQIAFRIQRTVRSRLVLLSDNTHLGALHIHERDGIPHVELYRASYDCPHDWRLLLADKPLPCMPFLRCGRVFAITYEGTPNGSIVELADDGSVRQTIVPECAVQLGQCATTAHHIYVSYIQFPSTVVSIWDYTGEHNGYVPCPTRATLRLLPTFTQNAETLFYGVESFVQPQTLFAHDPRTGQSTLWNQRSAPIDEAAYSIRETSYPSKDGTAIPITLVAGKDVDASVPHCTIMTGYGGFGVSMTPQFSILVAIMLELGVVFALPNIRGGGEFGTAWHDAARGKSRQVAFDDFISAADWLCSNGVTSSEQLAVIGGSNSGLLVGVAITQRPELFRTAICIAPLLDMVRYERFEHTYKWRAEYGTIDNVDDFHALLAYSPYHHVTETLDYPSTLFVTGDKDARCDPAHVRKMAARLQDRSRQTRPIIVDYSPDRGHYPTLPLTVRIDALSRRVAFLCNELGIAPRQEALHEAIHP